MSEIIAIEGSKIKIGLDDGKIATVPIAAVSYANPHTGDAVRMYKDGDEVVVNKVQSVHTVDTEVKRLNKVAYVLITLFLGVLGVHRFMRGQIGLGILYLFTLGGLCWAVLIDFIIALVKLDKYDDEFEFTRHGDWL